MPSKSGVKKVRVLFVCMGNICRSPTAEGVFLKLVKDENLADVIEVDSAGTHAYHIGEMPDARSIRAAAARHIDLSTLRARKVDAEDILTFDYVLAMDFNNLSILKSLAPTGLEDKPRLFLEYAPQLKQQHITEVPDPYYGGLSGFERVLDLVEIAAAGLLADIKTRHLQPAEKL